MKQSQHAWQVPGVAVGIVKNGKVIYLKGHGLRSLAGSEAVTPDTLFPIASCTKAFTTTLLAQLVEEGKLSWDDPPSKYVPYFRLADPLADRAVTLRDLLCHRTGLSSQDWLWHHAPWSLEESIRRAGQVPLARPFRSAFQYQSTMFTVAGFAAARAGGAPWEELIQGRLLEPLGMSRTVCTTRAAQEHERAHGYRLTAEGRIEPMEEFFMETANPAGSIYSCAGDLCRWLQFHLAGGKVKERTIVGSASLAETYTPQMAIPLEGLNRRIHTETVQMSYGMGWVIHDYRGRLLHSHAGAIDGFRAHVTLVPQEGLGIVLLNNLHQTQMNQALCNNLLDLLLDLPRKDWNRHLLRLRHDEALRRAEADREREAQRQRNTKPSRPLVDYAGKYTHPAFGELTLTCQGKTLVASWRHVRSPLQHWHFDTFTSSDPQLEEFQFQFQLDRTGQVVALHLEGPESLELRRGG